MIRDGINFILVGTGVFFFTVYLYFSLNEEKITNKFVLTANKTYLFNLAPMIGFTCLLFGEFIIWETQNNRILRELKLKISNSYIKRISDLKIGSRFIQYQVVSSKITKFRNIH